MRGNGSPIVTESPAYNDPTKNGNFYGRQQQWMSPYGNPHTKTWQGPTWKPVGPGNHHAETVSDKTFQEEGETAGNKFWYRFPMQFPCYMAEQMIFIDTQTPPFGSAKPAT
ncbi:hypothetical protein RUM43_009363 [Polyplax serrata]|uniref:Uncharacterized protein n=1 Tax=Polyplax serrata TaxID=468196 RepID=A0AAN8NZJ5_POLSC